MPALISSTERESILSLLKKGMDNQEIAAQVGVTPGQVAAVKAHVTMGTYEKIDGGGDEEEEVAKAFDTTFGLERASSPSATPKSILSRGEENAQ